MVGSLATCATLASCRRGVFVPIKHWMAFNSPTLNCSLHSQLFLSIPHSRPYIRSTFCESLSYCQHSMSDSSDSDFDSCNILGDENVSCGHESHGDEGGNAFFASFLLTRQNRGSVHKQKKRAAGERCTRPPQDSPVGSSAAYPLDLYLVDAEGGSRGYRRVAAGVEARSSPTHPRGEHDESDDEPPLWAWVMVICIFLAVVGIVLIHERVGPFAR
ncbi:hypothetical protein LZ31DRAFT_257101 [Colletotrichum somersetense]|nr:hypothetical protein LZ31DRAFT_257101 [Colletotrichum somersetense]